MKGANKHWDRTSTQQQTITIRERSVMSGGQGGTEDRGVGAVGGGRGGGFEKAFGEK